MTTLYAFPLNPESPNAHSYVYITGLSAKQLYTNTDSWFVCFQQHLIYAQTVHKIHTLTDPLLPVQYDHLCFNLIYILFNGAWGSVVVKALRY